MGIDIEHLRAGYGSAIVLQDVSLSVAAGAATAILGRNGMGKTTLLKALLGYLPAMAGHVRMQGVDVTAFATHQKIKLGVAYGPQDKAVFADLTVEQNLASVSSTQSSRERTLHHFPILNERKQQLAGTLSGGEQKMLVLARALISDPKIIVLDEISAGLQPAMVKTVAKALESERRERKTTILMVEQNLDLALSIADSFCVLKLGAVALQGSTREPGVQVSLQKALAP